MDSFFTVILLKDAPGMSFLYRIFPCFQLFGGMSYHKQNCWMKQWFFSDFCYGFPYYSPEGLCPFESVTSVNRASWPLAPALMDGYHLNSGRQKSSWLYLYFLSCYGDGILFFSIYKSNFLLMNYQLISLASTFYVFLLWVI